MRISGPTGSGKSAILESLEERGEQVLHLEELAKHKGVKELIGRLGNTLISRLSSGPVSW